MNGSFTSTFCCSEVAGNQAGVAGCCDRVIDLGGQIIHGQDRSAANAPSTVTQLLSTKSSSTTTASTTTGALYISSSILTSSTSASALLAAATSFSQPSLPLKKNVKIGVAIGVSLGVSLILGLVVFVIHERRLRIKTQKAVVEAQKAVADILGACDMSRAARTSASSCEVQGQTGPQELEHTQSQPGELYDGEVYEADIRI